MVAQEGTLRFPKAERRGFHRGEASVASAGTNTVAATGTSTVAATGTSTVASGGTIGSLVCL